MREGWEAVAPSQLLFKVLNGTREFREFEMQGDAIFFIVHFELVLYFFYWCRSV
jgi:hypothetical protein